MGLMILACAGTRRRQGKRGGRGKIQNVHLVERDWEGRNWVFEGMMRKSIHVVGEYNCIGVFGIVRFWVALWVMMRVES